MNIRTLMVGLVALSACGGSGTADDGAVDAFISDAPEEIEVDYTLLSETGLYEDIENKVLAEGVMEYAPEYRVWMDGFQAKTWIFIPPNRPIDTSDMDYWYFPIGVKVWQQISDTSGPEEVLLETRFIHRLGPDDGDVWQGSFVWNQEETDADYVEAGQNNIKGTIHDAPPASNCNSCHRGQPSHIIGFAAVQLSYEAPVNLNSLADDGLITVPPATTEMYPIPGDQTARDALGHLHADCAHCHTSGLGLAAFDVTGFGTRLFTAARTVEETETYTTGVDQSLGFWSGFGYTERIVRGDPGASGVLYRMSVRGGNRQMPPRFTDMVNTAAEDALTDWINSL